MIRPRFRSIAAFGISAIVAATMIRARLQAHDFPTAPESDPVASINAGLNQVAPSREEKSEAEANPFALPARASRNRPRNAARRSAPSPALNARVERDLRLLGALHATPAAHQIFHPPGQNPQALVARLKEDPRALGEAMRVARQFASVAQDCLGANLCNQRPESGYFDPYETRLHVMLNQSLDFLKAVRDDGSVHQGFPSQAELLANLHVLNPETQLLSLELLEASAPSETLRGELVAQAPQILSDAKPLYLSVLGAASQASPEARQQYLEVVHQSLSGDDVNTVAETAKHIDQLRLAENEYPAAVANLCHIKRDPATEHVWGEVRAHLISYQELHQFNTESPDTICR